ncbi:MAG: alanyl-tRNA editing protein [Rhodocyclaceae bacterium]
MTGRGSERLEWQDNDVTEVEALVVAASGDAIALDHSCFFPGGGGQPPDSGAIVLEDGRVIDVASAAADDQGVVWHRSAAPLPAGIVGRAARLAVDRDRRHTLSRHHTALHVLNAVALRDFGAWITGVQIGTEYSRIDFKLDGFSPAVRARIEEGVNAVLAEDRAVRIRYLSGSEFAVRGDLVRTLEVAPPVVDGRVRIVEIEDFDAQACGGTHVRSTAEIGRLAIFRTENKGRINRRFYVRLEAPH